MVQFAPVTLVSPHSHSYLAFTILVSSIENDIGRCVQASLDDADTQRKLLEARARQEADSTSSLNSLAMEQVQLDMQSRLLASQGEAEQRLHASEKRVEVCLLIWLFNPTFWL